MTNTNNIAWYSKLLAIIVAIGVMAALVYAGAMHNKSEDQAQVPEDGTPRNVTLSGTYVCLPHADTSGPQTEECAFGLKADDGLYYAVNFGASADAMTQFQTNKHIVAEGFVVSRMALSSDHWAKYNMEGIFTITRMIEPAPTSGAAGGAGAGANGKLDINSVCQWALTFMLFRDSTSADVFIAECKAGKHPDIIERYKVEMGFGDGAAI